MIIKLNNPLSKWGKFILLVMLIISIDSNMNAQTISNKGKEFWVGYGHHQFMESGQNNSQEMVLYLSTESQAATVTVQIYGSGNPAIASTVWRRIYNIPANTVISTGTVNANTFTAAAGAVGTMPKTGSYDCRLVTDPPPAGSGGAGLFTQPKGILITSDVPIVAYAHIYGSASSGATMLLPTEAWGYTYVSLNSKQSYASNCYNWTYIIAKENNTVVEITPSVLTRAQAGTTNPTGLAPGVTKTITLAKGQIYQIIGANDAADANGNGGAASTGKELSGTKIRSIVGPDGTCKPIAVFAGSSRTTNPASCGSGGGDNDNQQLFPQHTWGKRYLTTPFSGASTPSSFGTSTFKIAVADPLTVVKRNGVTLTGLLNGNYYQFESSTADYIESDKPVMMCQYMTGGGCLGAGGNGDPEMVVLSPIEQAVKRTVFYRNSVENITAGYLTLTVPTVGLTSLRIDGSNLFDHTYAHPNKAGYTVVVKRWTGTGGANGTNKGQSTAFCDSGFTAITYGLGSVESYAYNAGTNLENLSALPGFHNSPDTSGVNVVHPYTFVNTPTQLGANIAYKPTTILWKLTALSAVATAIPPPLADVTQNNPVASDSTIIGSAKYYLYKLPGEYSFSTAGTYYLPMTLTSPNPYSGGCSNEDNTQIEILVKAKPTASFTYTQGVGCGLDSVKFTSPLTTPEGYTIIKRKWFFTNNAADTSNLQNPSFYFPTAGSYPVKLAIITQYGGVDTVTINVTVAAGSRPHSAYTAAPTTLCVGQQVVFTPTSSVAGTTGWYWDFGFGSPQTVNTNAVQNVAYNTAGTYEVKHTIIGTSFTCPADTVKTTIIVAATPVIAGSTATNPTTCGGTNGSISLTGLLNNTPYEVSYTFGSVVTTNITSNASGVLIIPNLVAGTYTNISVKIGSCISNIIASQIVSNPAAPVAPTVTSNSPVCAGSNLSFTAITTTSGAITYSWTGPNAFTSNTQNPVIIGAPTNASGTYAVTATLNNCVSTATPIAVVVNAIPAITGTSSANPTTCATATGSISLNGLLANTVYAVSYNYNSNLVTPTITSNASGSAVISNLAAGTYSNITVALGSCVSSAVGPISLADPNPPATPVAQVLVTPICAGSTLNFSATSSTAGVSFEWTGPNSFTSTSATPSIPSATTNATGNYTVVVKLNGCTSLPSNAVSVVVNPIPATPQISSNSPVCAGSDILLASTISTTGVVTYNWTGPNSFTSASANPTIIAGTVAASGTYNLNISQNGCTSANATPITVVVNAVPVISSSSLTNTTTCATATGAINLQGLVASTSYSVSYVLNTATVNTTASSNASGTLVISGLAAGVYSNVTVSLNGCISNAVGPFTIADPTPPTPPTIASNNSPVCSGSSIILSANSSITGATFTWTTPGGTNITGNPLTIPNSTATDAGVYSVKITVNSCVSSPVTASVVVKPTPSITSSTSTNPTTCASSTGTITLNGLTAATVYTVNYLKNSSPQTATITANASGSVVISNLSAGAYSNISVTLNGCTSTDVGPFSLSDPNPPATPTITSNTPLCNGNTLNLTATTTTTGAIVYNWSGPNGFTSTAQSPSITNVTALATGNYTVTATLNSCTSASATVAVVVNTTPVISSSSFVNPANCGANTGSITLNGLANTTSYTVKYTLNTTPVSVTLSSNASGSLIIGSLAAGTYSAISVTLGICPSNVVGPIIIVDPTPPAVPVVSNNGPLCADAALNLFATSSTAGVTYSWTGPNSFSSNVQNPVIPTATTIISGVYTVTATINNCTSTASTTALVNPNPVADFSTPPFVCMPNGAVAFTNNSTIATGTLNYSWNFGDLSVPSSAVNPSYIYANSGNYQIVLTATSNAGCIKTASKSFNAFYSKPIASFSVTPDTICQGATNTFVDLSSAPNSTIGSRTWDFGDNTGWVNAATLTQTKLYATPGDYTIRLVVKNLQGCISDTLSKPVKVYLQPVVDAGPSFLVPVGSTVLFNPIVNDSVTVTFAWTPASDFVNPNILRPSLVANNNRVYTLKATGLGKCTATDTLTVKVLRQVKIPNVFSPNGDNINDTWEIENLGDYGFAIVEIFNRNGQVVYKSNGYSKPWDGMLNGKPLPVATYYYIIDFKNQYPRLSGSITILK